LKEKITIDLDSRLLSYYRREAEYQNMSLEEVLVLALAGDMEMFLEDISYVAKLFGGTWIKENKIVEFLAQYEKSISWIK